jgi:hypothetical protein
MRAAGFGIDFVVSNHMNAIVIPKSLSQVFTFGD